MSLKQRVKGKALALLCRFQRIYFAVLKKERLPIAEFLDQLNGLEYVILKSDVPYMPVDFPASYPIGKDLDVLASKEDFAEAVSRIEQFEKKSSWCYGVEVRRNDARIKMRFLWCGILHYQIDCIFDLGLRGLEADLLKYKVLSGSFFVPNLSVELLYRFFEYRDNPDKTHHLNCIKRYKDKWDVSLACRYGVALPVELEDE